MTPIALRARLRVVAPVPDHRTAVTAGAAHALRPAVLAHEGEALGVVQQPRQVDQVRCSHDAEAPRASRLAARAPAITPDTLRTRYPNPPPRNPTRALKKAGRGRCRGSGKAPGQTG